MANKHAVKTRDKILNAAIRLSDETHYNNLTRASIATRAGVSDALVSHHWGTMAQLRRSVMREAVRVRMLSVIAQGLQSRDPVAIKCDEETKRLAALSIL